MIYHAFYAFVPIPEDADEKTKQHLISKKQKQQEEQTKKKTLFEFRKRRSSKIKTSVHKRKEYWDLIEDF